MIDETLNSTLAKKNVILKNLYEFEKGKLKEIEEKINGLASLPLDRK